MKSSIEGIQSSIYEIRGQRVMIDSDLARLYGVETKVLNQSVKRNIKRFPLDFMFIPDFSELEVLRSQIVTAKRTSYWNHKRRSPIMLFTSHGVAMLSSILKSEKAIEINILIMREFSNSREESDKYKNLEKRIFILEDDTKEIFKIIFKRLDRVEGNIPSHSNIRRRIGIKKD